mmetsp:Transcript_2437/g.9609  ORF Transcript_2437/g.9609 Transcript_2437/m.9609 type:complete len:321 (-) Transcript_2437:568-1530(-)
MTCPALCSPPRGRPAAGRWDPGGLKPGRPLGSARAPPGTRRGSLTTTSERRASGAICEPRRHRAAKTQMATRPSSSRRARLQPRGAALTAPLEKPRRRQGRPERRGGCSRACSAPCGRRTWRQLPRAAPTWRGPTARPRPRLSPGCCWPMVWRWRPARASWACWTWACPPPAASATRLRPSEPRRGARAMGASARRSRLRGTCLRSRQGGRPRFAARSRPRPRGGGGRLAAWSRTLSPWWGERTASTVTAPSCESTSTAGECAAKPRSCARLPARRLAQPVWPRSPAHRGPRTQALPAEPPTGPTSGPTRFTTRFATPVA